MTVTASRRRALDVVFQALSALCVSILLRKSRNAEHAEIAEKDEKEQKEKLILPDALILKPLRPQRSLRFNSSSSEE